MEGGNNLEQATALVAAANRVVQDPNSVGSALRTIALRLRGTSVEILEEMGEETDGVAESTSKLQEKLKALTGVDILTDAGAYKDTYTILKEIGSEWQNISDIDKAATLELMAGKNRANTLSAILTNMEDLTGAYETALDAEGSALRENEAYMNSIQGRIDQFNNSLQTMWYNALDSDTVKGFVELGTALVKIVDQIGLLNTLFSIFVGLSSAKHAMGKSSVIGALITATKEAIAITKEHIAAKEAQKAATEASTAADVKESAQNVITAQTEQLEVETNKQATATDIAEAAGSEAATQADAKESAQNVITSATEQAGAAAGTGTLLSKLAGSATFKTIGKTIGGAIGGFIGSIILGAIISKVPDIIDALHETAEEIAEKAEDITTEFQTTKKNIDGTLKTLTTASDTAVYENLEQEFAKLAAGVNRNGQNISLTADEYKRYKEICETIIGVNPDLAAGYDDATQAIGNNITALSTLIDLRKLEARENAREYTNNDNLETLTKNAVNDYKDILDALHDTERALEAGWQATDSYIIQSIDSYFSQATGIDQQLINAYQAFQNQFYTNGIFDEQKVTNFDQFELAAKRLNDISQELYGDHSIIFDEEWLVDIDVSDGIQAIDTAQRELERASRGLINTLLQVPTSMEEYDSFDTSEQSFINQWIQNSGAFEIDEDTSEAEVLKWKKHIKDMVLAIANEEYAVEIDGIQISAQEILGRITDIDPSEINWTTYVAKIQELIDYLWQSVGAENNKLGANGNALEYNAFLKMFGLEDIDNSAVKEQIILALMRVRGWTREAATNFFNSSDAIEVQGWLKIEDWNLIDNEKDLAQALHPVTKSATVPIKAIDIVTEQSSAYQDVLAQTSKIVADNTEVTQEYKDSLIELGLSEAELSECFDENNKLVVKNASLIKKLVVQKRKEQAADAKLAKSQAQLEYYELYKKMRQLTNGQGNLTAAVRNEVNALYEQMNALEKTIAKYSALEQQLLGTADAFTEFENAQSADSETDYISSIENMATALGEAFSTGELGTEAAQAAIKGLVPESVYEDLDTVDEKMDAIYEHFKNGKLSQYIDIQFNEDGAIESAEMKLGNLRKFVEDGLANGVFTGKDWQHFDLSEDITSLEEFAEQMGVTKEVAFAFFETIEDHDIEWLNGDYSTLFDKLMPSREDIERLGQEMQDKFDQSPIDFTVRPKVSWEKMYEAGYEEFKDGAAGDYATMYSSSWSSANFGLYNEDGAAYEILLTPILPNGDVIENGKLVDYVNEQLSKGKRIDQLDVYIGSYKTTGEADQAGQQLSQMQAKYDKTKSNYNLENDIYKTTSALVELEHKLANGEVTLAEYSKQYNALMADQAKNTEAATEKVFGYIAQNEEANQAVEEQRQVVDGLTTKLKDLSAQYEAADNKGLDTTQLKADIEETKSLLDQATQKLGEVLQAKYALGSEPTVVEIQTVLDDISAKKKEIQDELGYTLDVHYEFNEETQEYTIKAGIQETDELKEYISLLNDEHELNVYLGNTTAETQEGLDKVVKTIDDAKTALEELEKVEPDVNTETIQASLDSVKSKAQEVATALNGLNKTITIEVEEKAVTSKTPSGSSGFSGGGGGHYAAAYGNAFATGNVGLPKAEKHSLLGELGAEMVVDPHSGRYYTVGDNGAEFVDLPKNAIIFNHKQTEGLLKHGHINSRGRAYAEGNAHVTFYGKHSSKDQWEGTGYSGWDDTTWSAAGALSDAADALSDSSDEFKEVFDWIEVRLEEINDHLNLRSAELENQIGYEAQNKVIDDMRATNQKLYNNLIAGANQYYAYAEKLLEKVPAEYRTAAQDGTIAIEAFVGKVDEESLEAIQNFREWVQKGDDLTVQAEETLTNIDDLARQAFDNIATYFDNELSLEESASSQFDAYNALSEALYGSESASIYQALIQQNDEQIALLTDKRNELLAELNSGKIKEGTQDWYDAVNAISEADTKIIELTTDTENYRDAVAEIRWENFDNLINRFEMISGEAEDLIDILSNKDLVDDDGNWTAEGITSLGLYAQQMENAEIQVEQYAEEMAYLKDHWQELGYTEQEYLEKMDDLRSRQADAIKSYHSSKDAIVDLTKARVDAIKKGIEKEIDAYKELIDAKKEALDAEKDIHDFEKDIASQEKDIATLERKIAALRGDTSASAAAQRKQLEAELLEAKQNLEETYYDRSIQNQQDALDKEYESFEEEKNKEMEGWDEYLENAEQVVADALSTVQNNTQTVMNTLTQMGAEYSLEMSETLTEPWKQGAEAIQDYSETFGASMSATVEKLRETAVEYKQLMAEMEAAGQDSVGQVNTNMDTYQGKNADGGSNNNNNNPGQNQPSNNPSKTEEPKNVEYSKGDKVRVDDNATNFGSKSGNAHMASFVPGGSYTVMQTSGNQVLIGKNGTATGWVNKEDLDGYAKGTTGVKDSQWAWIDEMGEELVLHAGSDGKLAYLTKGSAVVPHDLTNKLMDLVADPTQTLENSRPIISAPHITNNEINVNMEFGSVVNIEHVDNDTVPNLTKAVEKQMDKYLKSLNANIRKYVR